MQIIFDRNLDTERAINVTFFGENINRGTLNASMSKVLTAADTTVPDLSIVKQAFSTVDIVDGNILVPTQGTYNTVLDASAAYNSVSKEYSATVILGYVEGQTT